MDSHWNSSPRGMTVREDRGILGAGSGTALEEGTSTGGDEGKALQLARRIAQSINHVRLQPQFRTEIHHEELAGSSVAAVEICSSGEGTAARSD